MAYEDKHALVYSHVTSAFNQPTFYGVPPTTGSKARHPKEGSSHASKKLVEILSGKKSGSRSKSHSQGQNGGDGAGSSLLPSFEEHALHASITSLNHLGDALLRITHSGFVVELTLLDWVDGRPVAWEFEERVVPMPAVVVPIVSSVTDGLAHVYALLEGGFLYRMSFPLIAPFFHDENWNTKSWFVECTLPSSISRPIGGETGTMMLQGDRTIVVSVNNGALFRVEVEGRHLVRDRLHYPQHQSLLSKMFRTTNPDEDAILSIAQAPVGNNLDRNITDWVFTLSRDRSLRAWDKQSGNVITLSVPPAPGTTEYAVNTTVASPERTVRGSSVSVRGGSMPPTGAGAGTGSPAISHTPHLLPPERRSLLRTFYTNLDPNLRLLVFVPTASSPASLSGGFFVLYKAQGNSIVPIGEKIASERTARCTLRDFILVESDGMHEIHCLWEKSGESLYEMTELDIEVTTRHRSNSDSEDIQMGDRTSDWDEDLTQTSPWHLIKSLSTTSTPSSSASSIDFLSTLDLASPNVSTTILNALFRPGGGFSPYTIEEALKGYVHAAWVPQHGHFDHLNDANARLRAALKKSYPTLRARVGGIVGSRLGDVQSITSPLSAGSKLNASLGPGGNPFGASTIGGDDPEGPSPFVLLQQQQNEFYAALRRDWEGFLARCREIEKAGRWPVALGVVGLRNIRRPVGEVADVVAVGHCVVLERERMGMLVMEDDPLSIYGRIQREEEESQDDEGGSVYPLHRRRDSTFDLIHLALALKGMFAPANWSEVMDELITAIKSNMSMTYQDLLLDLARRVELEDMDESNAGWVIMKLDSIMEEGEEDEFIKALDGVSALVRAAGPSDGIVKVEEDEEEVGLMLLNPTNPSSFSLTGISGAAGTVLDYHNPWTKSLTASYLSSTLEARHDISSSMLFLLMLLKFKSHEWMESVSAIVLDELFAGLRSTCLLRGTAGRVMDGESKEPTPSANGPGHLRNTSRTMALAVVPRAGTADSMAVRMAGLNVRGGGTFAEMMAPPPKPHVHFAPTYLGSTSAAMPRLPPITRGSGSVPLLQTILGPLKRSFSLPYASDTWLLTNGIIMSDSMLIASPDEVRFAESLRRRGEQGIRGGGVGVAGGVACIEAAGEVVNWLPKGNACCYVAARLRLLKGDYDEAADLFERSGRSFGVLAFRSDTEAKALQAVLPADLEDLGSLSAYYQHIAALYEEDSQFPYAVGFYKLAIEALEDDETMNILDRKTELWYHVFRGQIVAEQWEGAYTTVAAMPVSKLRKESVSELVTTMCERNKVELLMSFNFLGFSQEVEGALDSKASKADPLERPLYAQILYAWYVKRGDYRRAATVMYIRARILGTQPDVTMDERYHLMALQLEAFAHAIHALCLLDPRDAWIGVPTGSDDDSEIVELEDIRRECELSRARKELLFRMVRYRGYLLDEDFELSPMEILHRYSEVGLYEEALYSASIFQIDMTVIFTAMVDMCTRISAGGEASLAPEEKGWLEYEIMALWEGTTIQKAWRLLQHSLERHDSASTGWQYRKLCLERIMDKNRTSSPPTWLTAFLQDREPEYLIRTCLRYHLVLPAIDYTLSMIQKANLPFDQGAVVGVTQTHLPYGLIDSVVAAGRTEEEKRRIGLIKAEIAARVGKVGRWEWS